MTENQDIMNALKQLVAGIKVKIEDSLSRGIIRPEEEIYFCWKMNNFQYTEEGIADYSACREDIIKQSWRTAAIKIEQFIKKSEEYSSVLDLLTQTLEGRDIVTRGLERFIGKLISKYLYEPEFGDTEIDASITTFLKDLNEEPLIFGAEVQLDGIIPLLDKIEFKINDINIILRQTKIEDIEREFPAYEFTFTQPSLKIPSAFLNIEFLGRRANEIDMKVAQAIAILRLFKVGSVKYISYRMYSESVMDFMAFGTSIAGESEKALEKCKITEEDAQILKKFWQIMTKDLPSFYDLRETTADYITIAYQRYCDALLQNGLIERRIANAVMGLESLFLKGSEDQELSYRLSLRMAKIFSLLAYDPYKVKKVVKDSYRIRSSFVHGGHLSDKGKRKLNAEYGDIKNFILLLLDYLRVSIVTVMFIKKEKGKEEYLDLIDDSCFDKNKEGQLNNLLNTARYVIRRE